MPFASFNGFPKCKKNRGNEFEQGYSHSHFFWNVTTHTDDEEAGAREVPSPRSLVDYDSQSDASDIDEATGVPSAGGAAFNEEAEMISEMMNDKDSDEEVSNVLNEITNLKIAVKARKLELDLQVKEMKKCFSHGKL